MSFADRILAFNQSLLFDDSILPHGIRIMNPFMDAGVQKTTSEFYKKYFSDDQKRFMIIGINPGRFGGGVTGIPFTDPHKLKNKCGINVEKLSTPELSADFVYKVIDSFGGPNEFYRKFFLTAVCPLGFVVRKGEKEINYNYYDSKELQIAAQDFIVDTLKKQIDFGVHRNVCFCLGTGKNFNYLSKLNDTYQFFDTIIPLDHPRFIMQYRRKRVDEYVQNYLDSFRFFASL